MAGKLVLFAAALALALPAAAEGATFCVDAPGCVGSPQPTLTDALAAADGAAGADRVELGPGTYDGPFAADADNVVEIVGAGRGATVLRAAGNGITVVSLAAPDSAVRGLTVRLGTGSAVTGIDAQRAADVAIEGTASPATGFLGSTLERSAVDLGGAGDTTGVSIPGAPVVAVVEDTTVRAQTGIATGFSSLPVAVRRTRVVARTGISVPGAVAADDVAIALTGGPLSTGVQVGPAVMIAASATLRHVTIAGTGDGVGLAVAGGPPFLPVPVGASAMLLDSVIHGVQQHVVTSASDCGALPPPCFPSTATVTTSHSAYDPARITSTGPGGVFVAGGTPSPVSGDPRLRDDLRPRFDSPLVDAAEPGAGGDRDAAGEPRAVDGDGAGGARADIGAYEYQRRPPVVTGAYASPGEAMVGQPITFGVTGTDPEGEPITATWAFSDGTTATGLEVRHAFAAPGPVVANLRLTDAAGAASVASVTARVNGDPGSPPPGSAKATPLKLTLRAAKRRDKRPPYRFTLRGRLTLPAGVACDGGKVRLAVKAGKRSFTRGAPLRADCTFRATLRLGRKRARRVAVTPRFLGTATLAPRAGATLKLRAG